MGHKWILAVLADLRTYAEINDLQRLAAALEEVEGTAEAEITLSARGAPPWARGDGVGPGTGAGADRGGALAG